MKRKAKKKATRRVTTASVLASQHEQELKVIVDLLGRLRGNVRDLAAASAESFKAAKVRAESLDNDLRSVRLILDARRMGDERLGQLRSTVDTAYGAWVERHGKPPGIILDPLAYLLAQLNRIPAPEPPRPLAVTVSYARRGFLARLFRHRPLPEVSSAP